MLTNENTDSKPMSRMADRTNKRVFFRKRQGCPLSVADAPEIDYKNPDLLLKFVSEGGRMLPSRITNVCAKKQRKLKNAIKIARILALMPFMFQV
ncbi:30S ribosomal protein S18 [Candidatus Tisiphia endosymbiont of Beris chalybata]|uniref:30S ribosomal protein S18 n=1 Tax=Candidatus Tisiphia endosymbiont of Beris chalybata TaxID=3066262 RepID=UPI00312C9845